MTTRLHCSTGSLPSPGKLQENRPSPIAVAGTKEMISYMRDHRIDDGLQYIATWNAAMLQSEDLRVAVAAHMNKQKPTFAD